MTILIGQNALKAEMGENDLSLNFVCPTCGVKPQEKCELKSGVPRFSSHVERWDIVKDHRPKPRLTKPPPAQKTPKQRQGDALNARKPLVSKRLRVDRERGSAWIDATR